MFGYLQKFWRRIDQLWSRPDRRMVRSRRNIGSRTSQTYSLAIESEMLDIRNLLSATAVAVPTIQLDNAFATSGPTGYTPTQLQTAYGFSSLSLSNGSNGTGQTIAIVDAYNDPTIQTDLQAFDRAYGLANPPNLTVMSQTGSTTNLPSTDPSKDKQDDWEVEESLDVEWAHALAPGANIVLVEANSANDSDLNAAISTAKNLPGVSVISMSWGDDESSADPSENSLFTTPSGHQGITYVAATGDDGEPGEFPADSPNVLAVGGTTLQVSSSGQYLSESGWSDSGGGISEYEAQPAYQKGIVTQSTTMRTIPDVSFDANPSTGVAVYDSFSGTSDPWEQIGGTSLSAPSWAAIIAIADQQRAVDGLSSLDGATQTLPMLYQLDQTDPSVYHDITTGNNGYSAGTGYDLVTGLGSPVVNLLVPALAGSSTTSAVTSLAFEQSPSTGVAGQTLGSVKVEIENQTGQVITNNNSTVTLSIVSGPGGFTAGSTVSVAAVNGIATFSNLTLDTAGSYTFSASDAGLTSGSSNSVTISPAAASKLVFQQSPSSGSINQPLNPSVTVAVEDPYGNVVTSNESTVTISVAYGPAGFSFGSTTSAVPASGIATFSNLILGTAGQYALGASDIGLASAISSSFTVNGSASGPPTISNVETTPASYMASGVAIPVTSSLTLSDSSSTIDEATVSLGPTYHSGEDLLSFTNTSKITGSFNSSTGTLTLTGTDTLADYKNALRSVTYQDLSANPTPNIRRLTFIVYDGAYDSASVYRYIDMTSLISNVETSTKAYAAGSGATPVTNTLTLGNTASDTITGATVQIDANYVNGQDILAFTNTANITGSFNSSTGTLTLTGTATVADYQAALRSVTYTDTSGTPTLGIRRFSITVDGATNPVFAVDRYFDVVSVATASGPPTISNVETTPASYMASGVAIPVTSSLTLSDSSSTIDEATVSLGPTYHSGEDLLSFTNTSKITGSFNSSTGTLTLTGTDTLADYENALRSVRYQDLSANPTPNIRRLTFVVYDGAYDSASVYRYIDMTSLISNVETSTGSYAAGSGATPVTNTLTLGNTASGTITGATVQIDANYVNGQDILAFTNTANITGSFNSSTGTLTLTGTATVADYQAALRSVTYTDTSGTPTLGIRRFAITVDGATNPDFTVDRYFDVV